MIREGSIRRDLKEIIPRILSMEHILIDNVLF